MVLGSGRRRDQRPARRRDAPAPARPCAAFPRGAGRRRRAAAPSTTPAAGSAAAPGGGAAGPTTGRDAAAAAAARLATRVTPARSRRLRLGCSPYRLQWIAMDVINTSLNDTSLLTTICNHVIDSLHLQSLQQ